MTDHRDTAFYVLLDGGTCAEVAEAISLAANQFRSSATSGERPERSDLLNVGSVSDVVFHLRRAATCLARMLATSVHTARRGPGP